jgi:hypothetical protein
MGYFDRKSAFATMVLSVASYLASRQCSKIAALKPLPTSGEPHTCPSI